MKLSPEDMTLFYKLMWPLQFYVNQKLNLLPNIASVEVYAKDYNFETKLPVRNALYEKVELIDAFIDENPAQLNDEELAIVWNWKRFVAGDFYIERYLKQGAVLIGGKPSQVYLVLGLTDSLEEVFQYYQRPPILVKTVLLPFKGQIIYDGLCQTYSVFFGGGIKGDLKETYLAAKQNQRIITTLEPSHPTLKPEKSRDKPPVDWRPEVDELVKAINKLKGDQQLPLQSEAFSLLKTSGLLAQAATHTPDDLAALWKLHKHVSNTLRKLESALYRAEM